MTASVRLGGPGGEPIDLIYPVSNLVDSTKLQSDGFSGDYTASCTWAAPSYFGASWFRSGTAFEVVEGGIVTWGGTMVEPTPGGDQGWTLSANGYGSLANRSRAYEPDLSAPVGTVPLKPTMDANAAVDDAHTNHNRMPNLVIQRNGSNLGTVPGDPYQNPFSLAELLTAAAKAAGKWWWVDSHAYVSMVAEPFDAQALWMLTPGTAVVGTTDPDYYTDIYGLAVYSVNPTSGDPNAYFIEHAGDTQAAFKYGRNEVQVNLTPRGVMSTLDARADVDGRFAQVGVRMAYTTQFDVTGTNLHRIGFGPADPLGMCGRNGAGTKLVVPGSGDNRTGTTVRGTVTVLLGEVQRIHDDRRVVATPMGFKPRDLSSALADAQPKDTGDIS